MTRVEKAITAIAAEHCRATMIHEGRFASAHEGYAVLLEEVDELWDLVKMKKKSRPSGEMLKEAIQVAAMALRFATECCDD